MVATPKAPTARPDLHAHTSAPGYHCLGIRAGVACLANAIARLERTKTGEQLFRAGRIAAVGIGTYAITHNGVDSAAAAGIIEAAFRQAFPVRTA